ncbi:hypothetical protein K458DRAFT_425101 [Lentithecium fluviatile CBS 122367]|uniref:Uncharacterized protein n=1 Tax=Lentithecium fluviatile CBS 122367 TaxID=1168545 RepID=A0A6G1ICS5_9PLEO|nr:hypothetical protein K458DRAFT_425101 [Lentithecium fluviatile CBS 122367]
MRAKCSGLSSRSLAPRTKRCPLFGGPLQILSLVADVFGTVTSDAGGARKGGDSRGPWNAYGSYAFSMPVALCLEI